MRRISHSLLLIGLGAATVLHGQHSVAERAPRWKLSKEPVFRLGNGSSPSTEFHRIRGLARLESGEVVVADGSTNELRVFTSHGRHLKTLSRTGQGPGEFESIGQVFAGKGDSIYVLESSIHGSRVHRFTVSGGFIDRVPLRTERSGALGGLARLANGAVLVRRGTVKVATPPPVGEVARDSATLGLVRLDDDPDLTWIGTVPAVTWLGFALPAGAAMVRTSMTSYRFGPQLVFTASGDQVWIGDSGTGEIHIYDASGARIRSVNLPFEPREILHRVLEAGRKAELATITDPTMRARVDAIYDRASDEEHAPVFERFLPGENGEVWIEIFYEDPDSRRPVFILDRNGNVVGMVRLPERTRLEKGGSDYLLGVERDQDDVEHVVLYGIVR